MSQPIAGLCVADIEKAVKSIALLKGKVFQVYSEEELFDKTKGIVLPCVGVVYEGIRAIPENKETHRIGVSAELVVSLMILFKNEAQATANKKMDAVGLLDDVRGALIGKRSPSQHFWKFQLEAAAPANGAVLVYLQRWATPVQLT